MLISLRFEIDLKLCHLTQKCRKGFLNALCHTGNCCAYFSNGTSAAIQSEDVYLIIFLRIWLILSNWDQTANNIWIKVVTQLKYKSSQWVAHSTLFTFLWQIAWKQHVYFIPYIFPRTEMDKVVEILLCEIQLLIILILRYNLMQKTDRTSNQGFNSYVFTVISKQYNHIKVIINHDTNRICKD